MGADGAGYFYVIALRPYQFFFGAIGLGQKDAKAATLFKGVFNHILKCKQDKLYFVFVSSKTQLLILNVNSSL